MDFLIFYEHFNREMENIILIKKQLINMGYSVEISHFSMNSYSKHVLFNKPKVVVTPWLRDNENIYHYTRFSNTPKLVNLQCEQIYSYNDFKLGIASTTGLALKANHFCWGEAAKKRLMNEGISEENLKVTGAVQLDFCRPEFDSYYLNRLAIAEKYNLDTQKKWVLFISSFSYATYNEKSLEILHEQWGDFTEFVDISKKSRLEVLQWIEELLKEDSNIEFIYRPHPSENIDRNLEEMSNVFLSCRIINDYSVKQWIKISDSIVTWYSTSVAEICAMNKSFCIVRPVTIPENYEVDIMRNANFITTREDFIKYINGYDKLECPINMQIFHEYYLIENTPAYVNVANYLVEILNQSGKNECYSFTRDDKKKFRNKYKNSIITSLIADFTMKTNIKFSRIIPFKKSIFRNIEQFVDKYPKQLLENIETNIESVMKQHEK